MTINVLENLGLLVSETGKITGIDIGISASPDLAPGLQRRVRLKRMLFDSDLEMTVVFELRVFDIEGNDLYELYSLDSIMSPSANRERLSRVQPLEIPRTTRDCFRDPETGLLVDSETPGAVSELQFFQSMALPHLQAQGLPITGTEPYLVVVYLMLANIIREKDALGEF